MGRPLITSYGFEALQKKLNSLKLEQRPVVEQSLAEARSRGDLSENSEFDAAREKLWEIDGQITELETLLADAEVFEIAPTPPEEIRFGTSVQLANLTRGQEETYHIVGIGESDSGSRRISYLTPLAQALIGRRAGEEFEARVPSGALRFKVLQIRPLEPPQV